MHKTRFALQRNIGGALLLLCILTTKAGATEPAAAENVSPQAQAPLRLHVPSPDWRDQIIYFVMTDRFDDGDPGNNDQGAGEYDPADGRKYSGGDLAGLTRRLDYIKQLGATAVWITPPVANQWWNPRSRYGGYHGYWAEDFKRVDPHLGTLDDYRRLSHALHEAGMYLLQDIVVNHTGDYFSYAGNHFAGDPATGFLRGADSRGRAAPTGAPFDRNDARDPAQRAAGLYHWTPAITDYNDPQQLLNYQLADLDDLNTENPEVRHALRDAYGHWIREVGVDGFRVDTAFYVPPDYFADFMHAGDAQAPGMVQVAASTGREHFHVFGEGFGIDRPYQDLQARRIDRYMRGAHGEPLLTGMLNFPLYGSLGDVFARGRPPAELAYRIQSDLQRYADPHTLPTFVDNHDVDRFLAGGSEAGLRQALLLLMTLPGIPTLYYGTEQGFKEQRAWMFANGQGAGGRDHFDTGAPLYRYLQEAIALRRTHRVFSRGTPSVLAANAAAPGVLAYRMQYEGETALVIFNSADTPTLLDNLPTGAHAGQTLQGLFGLHGRPADLVIGAGGRIDLPLPARSGQVWRLHARQAAGAPADQGLSLQAPAAQEYAEDFMVQGHSDDASPVQVVVDGDLDRAQRVLPDALGHWQANIDTSAMMDTSVEHRLVAWQERGHLPPRASQAQTFKVQRQWRLLAELQDPTGDDAGPEGRYLYPDDSAWRQQRPLDIEQVRVYGAGGALKLELRMHQVMASWSPANGFDHVAFVVFVQLPGKDGGIAAMPLQNAELPRGMRWHYRLRAHGWSNALFSAQGASAGDEGTVVTPAASLQVDRERNTVTFVLPASALGGINDLSGARLYIATWDYDGGFRTLTPVAQPAGFGGGDGRDDPLVMDDAWLVLP